MYDKYLMTAKLGLKKLQEILNAPHYNKYIGSLFYYRKNNKYIAVDNTTSDCWVEEFCNSEDAIKWLQEAV